MKTRKIGLVFAALFAAFTVAAQPSGVRFHSDSTLRIMQFTDLHYTYDFGQSGHVLPMLTRLIEAEKPDLVIVTGDLIYARPGEPLLREICGAINATGTPYAITLGNHDAEQGLTHAELYAILRTLPGCVNGTYNPAAERQGDFVIPVLSTDGSREAARIYVMDSNDYNADDHSYKGFTPEQIAWYKAQSEAAAQRNGAVVNGLLFFHVPLTEYAEAYNTAPITGFRLERECPARDNTGMFDVLKACGEVSGTFAGHDHSNNYIAQKEGIALVYGHYSGGFGEYQELLSGARVIELRQDERGFTTWERLASGRKERKTTFPGKTE